MATPEDELLIALELHSVPGIQAALDAGLDPRVPIRGKPPVDWLTEMYTRSHRLPDCLRLLLRHGAALADDRLAPVLLDDEAGLDAALAADPSLLRHRVTMVSAFTPLVGATLLHVAAEYGHARAVRVLVAHGADLEAQAASDEHGLGGHTPIFHTVNAIENHALPVLRLLLAAGARTDVRLAGLTWGKGFEWETTLFDLTPLSYAQMGLLPQMHRAERDVYANVELLLQAAGRPLPLLGNVPNRYLAPRRSG